MKRMSESELERMGRQIDAAGLKRRWEEVVRTSGHEASLASPSLKPHWLRAHEQAKKVVAVLELAVKAEKAANRAWREVRQAEEGKKQPVLTLVVNRRGQDD